VSNPGTTATVELGYCWAINLSSAREKRAVSRRWFRGRPAPCPALARCCFMQSAAAAAAAAGGILRDFQD